MCFGKHVRFGLRENPFVAPIAILAALTAFSPPADAQQQDNITASPGWHFGFELFRMLVEENGLQVTTNPSDVMRRPSESMLVVLGNPERSIHPMDFQRFVDRGGAALVATDESVDFGQIGDFRGPRSAVVSRRSSDHYQGHNDCLIVTDVNQQVSTGRDVNSVIVNRTGWLRKSRRLPRNWSWKDVARLPNSLDPVYAGRQTVLAQIENSSPNGGKAILAADLSLFTNGMLWHGDNALLAINVSRFLADGRKQVCFLIEGRPVNSYRNEPQMQQALPPSELPENLPLPETDPATMLRIANSIVQNVEQSNLFNEILANQPRNVRLPIYRRGILFAIAAAVALFALWRLMSTGPNSHRPMPIRTMMSAFDLSSNDKVKSAEFGLSASLLARELCREVTGEDSTASWLRQLSPNAANGQCATRPEYHEQMKTVLELAVNTRTVHISRRRFEQVGRKIQTLRQLHEEGRLLQS